MDDTVIIQGPWPKPIERRPHFGRRPKIATLAGNLGEAWKVASGPPARRNVDPTLAMSLASKMEMHAMLSKQIAEEASALHFHKQAATFSSMRDYAETCAAEIEAEAI